MINRRQFMLVSSTSLASFVLFPEFGSSATRVQPLRAEPVKTRVVDELPEIDLWGFNGSTPGNVIRVKKGRKVNLRFENRISQPSAIHWHGIRIDNRMDGVPGLTQSAVEPKQNFQYEFTAPDAGTYWYHSHNRSLEQVARGLYGALIVEENNPPEVDHDIVVFVDDWRLNQEGTLAGGFENMHDQAHAGRLGNFAKAIFQENGKQIKRNQRIRLRMINVATDRIFPLAIEGVEGKVVAYDGMPLETPIEMKDLYLSPGQRLDLIADVVGKEIVVNFAGLKGNFKLGSLPVVGEVKAKSKEPIPTLEKNKLLKTDLSKAAQLKVAMQGGAMSRSMMTDSGIWAFNGVSGLGKKPMIQIKRGESAVFELVNDTRFPHAIHLHGHHFQELNGDKLQNHRDTLLLDVNESKKIAFVADNPGKWLFHCHMLAHQAAGMKNWFEVV